MLGEEGWLVWEASFLPWEEGGVWRGSPVLLLEQTHWNPVPPGIDFLSPAP